MSISEAVRRSPGEVRGAGGDSRWRCALPSRKGRKAKVWSSVSRREEVFLSTAIQAGTRCKVFHSHLSANDLADVQAWCWSWQGTWG